MNSVAETRRGDLWSCLAAVKIHFSPVSNYGEAKSFSNVVLILIRCWGDMRFKIRNRKDLKALVGL